LRETKALKEHKVVLMLEQQVILVHKVILGTEHQQVFQVMLAILET
jgi:hypothetical protein